MASIYDFNTAAKQTREVKAYVDPETAFRSFMIGHGYAPQKIIADGEIHRFKGPEDRGTKKSAWYLMFGDSPQAGMVGDWKTDFSSTWSLKSEAEMDYAETQRYRERIDRAKAKREHEAEAKHAKARIEAQKAWSEALPLSDHPYLSTKKIRSYGAKLHHGNIIWPLMDYQGVVHSYQTIAPDGEKRFLQGGKKKGCFYTIPGGNITAICEGYSTGCSIAESTGWTVVVAVDAGNLPTVAEIWRKNNPTMEIIVCGDNDANGKGQDSANKAAQAISATVKTPLQPGMDWNDVHCQEGIEAVKSALVERLFRTTITDWGINRFAGPAPEREWLVKGTIPAATLTILSAQGDAGKGMLLLDLGLKVAGGKVDGMTDVSAFGNEVSAFGGVVILTAEDDKDEMHRRIEGIIAGREIKHPLYIVPLPNAGGPMPLVVPGRNGPEASYLWHELVAQIKDVKGIKLIVVDPLASFVMADVNSDPAVGAFTTGLFASLATQTGAAVIVAHHLAKTKVKIASPEDARSLVRGSTAIVDGARSVYVLWGTDEKDSKMKCKHLGIEWQRRVKKQSRENAVAKVSDLIEISEDRAIEVYKLERKKILGETLLEALNADGADAKTLIKSYAHLLGIYRAGMFE